MKKPASVSQLSPLEARAEHARLAVVRGRVYESCVAVAVLSSDNPA